ncbi:hypothetical protein [Comamonas odontotermitis]|uniref:hypothetical protein n=1 Tax=Comamonas odontotermitis TaxID=379895 RepID=UPI001CC694A5|nr:hypothetical protein [Comamonas odontotermitis]UBB16075.1 hypothetical protein LAD35_14720 [Comamonas odontotermitis]
MAIDLFCHVSRSAGDVTDVLELLLAKHQEFFEKKFLISKATESSDVGKEVALEHGLHARSTFLIRVNDKSAVGQISKVADIVKDAFGDANVVVLFENEERQ